MRRVSEVLIDFCFCNPWLWLDARNTPNIYMIEKHLIFAVEESSYSLLSHFFKISKKSFFENIPNRLKSMFELLLLMHCNIRDWSKVSTDTGENVQKWTRVFSTRRWVILVARTCRKKREENSVSTFGRFRLWKQVSSPRLYRLRKNLNFLGYILGRGWFQPAFLGCCHPLALGWFQGWPHGCIWFQLIWRNISLRQFFHVKFRSHKNFIFLITNVSEVGNSCFPIISSIYFEFKIIIATSLALFKFLNRKHQKMKP